jgi:hypothetical protein
MHLRYVLAWCAAAIVLIGGLGAPFALRAESATADHEIAWQPVVSEEEGFSALFPAEPTETTVTSNTMLGSIVATKFFVRVRGALFAVERHRLPRLSAMIAPTRIVLDQTRRAILSNREAEQISYETPPDALHAQRILVYRSHETELVAEEVHLHLRGRNLYLVTAEAAAGDEDVERARRFLASFQLLDETAAPAAKTP